MITIFLEDGKSLESQKNIPKVKYSYSVNNKWSNGSIHIYINLIKTKKQNKKIYIYVWLKINYQGREVSSTWKIILES